MGDHIRLHLLGQRVDGQHPDLGTVDIPLDKPVVSITPGALSRHVAAKDLYGFNGVISTGVNNVLEISGFDYFTLQAYHNEEEVRLSTLKVYDIKDFFRLNRLYVRNLDVDRASPLLVGCVVGKCRVGVEVRIQPTGHEKPAHSDVEKADLRDSTVEELDVYVGCKELNLQKSTVNRVHATQDVELLRVWEDARIGLLTLVGQVRTLEFRGCVIDRLRGTDTLRIGKYVEQTASVGDTENLALENFDDRPAAALRLCLTAARNKRDRAAVTELSYQIQQRQTTEERSWARRLFRRLLGFTCGYGFRPGRAVLVSVAIVLGFSIMFALSCLLGLGGFATSEGEMGCCQSVAHAPYLSLVSFTTLGFGDIVPVHGVLKTLAAVEALLGMYMMAILVYALTKTYSE